MHLATSLSPSPHVPPDEKECDEQSQFLGAYYCLIIEMWQKLMRLHDHSVDCQCIAIHVDNT